MTELPGVGATIGPFHLLAQLGEGGFAPVFLASEEYGGVQVRIVALKLFSAETLGEAGFQQVVAEARSLSRVEHRNVVRYLQILDDKASGLVGLAMEHVKGESLGSRLEKQMVLSVEDTLAVGAAVAAALAAVHTAGLVHRDVKPDNVIDADGVYKLIDFGIATRRRSGAPTPGGSLAPGSVRAPVSSPAVPSSASMRATPALPVPRDDHDTDTHARQDRTLLIAPQTRVMSNAPLAPQMAPFLADTITLDEGEHEIAGTLGYIDPACFSRRAPPDPSSDLYALGAMMYECLAGRLPAQPAPNSTVLRTAVAYGITPPPPLNEVAPHVPTEVANLVNALVDPDRARRPRLAELVAVEIERIRRGVLGRRRQLPEDGPFRGLDAFDERHRDVFFGRSVELALALDGLRQRGLLALIGPSGSGKSSLARAGVLPAIVEGELAEWPTRYVAIPFRPGTYPRLALDTALTPMFGRGAAGVAPDVLLATLSAWVAKMATGVVLYVDALEELVTVADPTERVWLADLLAQIARTPVPGVRAVVTARRDFFDALLGVPPLGAVLARSVQLLAPLTANAFGQALEERLAAYGYTLEDPSMLAELNRELAAAPDAMPLFEFALARLWAVGDHRRRCLDRAALARIGGISGALEQHAEETLRGLVARVGPVAEEATRRVFIALTTARGTRVRRSSDDIAALALGDRGTAKPPIDRPMVDAALGTFEAARLIVVEDGGFTLAHETLLQWWPRLRLWIASVRRERELAEEVERATSRWTEKGRDKSLLLRGRALRDARDLAASGAVLSDPARQLVTTSRRAEARGVTGVVVLAGSVLVGLVVLFVLYQVLERDARAKEREAEKVAGAIRSAQQTPEADRARAVRALLEEKRACEKELSRRAACADNAESSVPDAGHE